MSNTDTELFELCKQVYEATGWFQARKVTSWYHYFEPTPAKYHPGEWRIAFKEINNPKEQYWEHIPLYTSDYLLEKLPMEKYDIFLAPNPGVGWWCASFDVELNVPRVDANTPLKALLKLVIALDDAGVKL